MTMPVTEWVGRVTAQIELAVEARQRGGERGARHLAIALARLSELATVEQDFQGYHPPPITDPLEWTLRVALKDGRLMAEWSEPTQVHPAADDAEPVSPCCGAEVRYGEWTSVPDRDTGWSETANRECWACGRRWYEKETA